MNQKNSDGTDPEIVYVSGIFELLKDLYIAILIVAACAVIVIGWAWL